MRYHDKNCFNANLNNLTCNFNINRQKFLLLTFFVFLKRDSSSPRYFQFFIFSSKKLSLSIIVDNYNERYVDTRLVLCDRCLKRKQ